MKKRRKQQSNKCPKCNAKLKEGEGYQRCPRCGYTKQREVSNLTKRLFGIY